MSETPESTEQTPILELPHQNDLLSPVSGRQGWLVEIPGHRLKQDHPLWSAAQKAGKVTVEGVYLTSDEEKKVALSAASEPGSSGLRQMLFTLYAVDGQKIAHMDKPDVWEALGALGRAIYARFYQKAYSIDDEEMAVISASFRLSAG